MERNHDLRGLAFYFADCPSPEHPMNHCFEADGIQLSFGLRQILSDVYLKCESGSVCGLLGRNGQGKSCLMNLIYGTMKGGSRSVRIDEESVLDLHRHRHLMTFLPQFNFVPGSYRISEGFGYFGQSFADFTQIFPEFKGKENAKFGQQSGGFQRLLEVCLIINSASKFSMLDEPFSHIMPVHVETIQDLITSVKATKGFLITDHLYQNIIDISDKLYILENGKVHAAASAEDLKRFTYLPV